ncbi:MAG: endopeptidase La, partial [Bacteroidales bacterium]|nr:endopeptidase La [Bacteroidales bacterium]
MYDRHFFGPEEEEMNIIPVMNIGPIQQIGDDQLPETVPLLPLRGAVLFPDTVIPIPVRREKSIKLIKDAFKSDKMVGIVTQRDDKFDNITISDLFEIGTLGRIIKILEIPDGPSTAIIQGIKRFKIKKQSGSRPYISAAIDYLDDIMADEADPDMPVIIDGIKETAMHILKHSHNIPADASLAIKEIEDHSFLINFVATTIDIENQLDKMELLRVNHLKERGIGLLKLLDKQNGLLKIKDDIQRKVKVEINQQQREYYLNNQLKTIQEELGMNADEEEFENFHQQALDKNWPDHIFDAFMKELKKLEKINPNSPDYTVQYGYVQFMLELPWDDVTKDNLDLSHAQKVLDKDHFGLESVKERIIEYLAVLKLKGDMKSPILCLYGPPGVGKTSLGKSIAKALGRKYSRISLGGLHDESEIRGHRRTYIGAMPGRLIQNIKRAGSANPVIVLDEIDKVAEDFKGDPASALLEVLDPEQNTAFHDNYLDLDYDLSRVLFITTANNIGSIHPALRDRMEMINVSGYLAEEKVEIAKNHLLPKQLKEHGLSGKDLRVGKKELELIIDEYTRESGVRGLDKQIAKLARVTAKKIALGEEHNIKLTKEDIR